MEVRGENDNHAVVWFRYRVTRIRNSYDKYRPAEPTSKIVEEKYIYSKSDGKLLPLSQEGLMKVCQPKKNEIIKYIRVNDIEIDSEESYMKVLDYYNSLQSE